MPCAIRFKENPIAHSDYKKNVQSVHAVSGELKTLELIMDFNAACEKAKAFTKKPSDSEFLEFYGLFKQATVGDVNIPAPSVLDLKAKAKWEAWNKHKGLSTDDAKQAYIAVYQKYAPKYA